MPRRSMLNPNQMRLFMRPGEILDTIHGSADAGPGRQAVEGALRGRKIRHAQESYSAGEGDETTLYDSIKKGGVRNPVILYPGSEDSYKLAHEDSRSEHFWLGNGHHRVASALTAEGETGQQQWVPVRYDVNYMGRGGGG